MKYKTGDLSRILNVSSNTIRRYEEMGYLNPTREENNGYRYFGGEDVAKMVYISKYRKFDFGHDEIGQLLQSDISVGVRMCEEKMAKLDEQIATLTAVRHMLKDDIVLMKRIYEYGDGFVEKDSNELYYVTYQKGGKLLSGAGRSRKLYDFMYTCPEIKYCYVFRKENVLARRVVFEDAVALKTKDAVKFNIAIDDDCIEHYPRVLSNMHIVKLPIDFMNEDIIDRKEVKRIIFDDIFANMKEKGYKIAGDLLGVRMGISIEPDCDYEYVLLSYPVESIN